MKLDLSIAALMSLATLAQAHMEMSWPPPFRSKNNPYSTNIDYNNIDPLRADGQNYPCKGYHSLVGTSQGKSVVTWEQGQSYNLSLSGTAVHDGGSCQASLSYDGGNTWKVIQSYHGGCPLRRDWNFVLPSDAPTGEALFAWSWFNRIGNREMYMNCASVTIKGPKTTLQNVPEKPSNVTRSAIAQRSSGTSFFSRPDIFRANTNNGCGTIEGFDVVFPNPGPDVSGTSDRPLAPQGKCGTPEPFVSSSASIPVSTARTTTICAAGDPRCESITKSITSVPSASVATSAPAVTTASSGGAAKAWEKCGGVGWTGPTGCDDGFVCQKQSEWYHQCVPAPAQTQTQTQTQPIITSKASASTLKTSTSQTQTQTQPIITSKASASTLKTSTRPSSASATSSIAQQPAQAWGQCGGVNWTGPTQCAPGLKCSRQSEWYSQCVPGTEETKSQPVTTTKPPATSTVQKSSARPSATSSIGQQPQTAKLWGQCGGRTWTGPTQCAAGSKCSRQSEWYSQCIPA